MREAVSGWVSQDQINFTANNGNSPRKLRSGGYKMNICKTMVNDFFLSAKAFGGYGCFQGAKFVNDFAQNLPKNAMRKFRRYQIVPQLFFLYLKKIGVIDPTATIPQQGIHLNQAEIILKAAGLRTRLSQDDYSECGLQIQSGSQGHIWHNIINQIKYMKHVVRPRGCGHP